DILDSSERFFADFEAVLANMGETEFQAYQQGLKTLLLEKPKNMGEKFARFWRDADIGRTTFDTNEAIAAEVDLLTLDDVRALYQHALLEQGRPWVIITQRGQVQNAGALTSLPRDQLRSLTVTAGEGPGPSALSQKQKKQRKERQHDESRLYYWCRLRHRSGHRQSPVRAGLAAGAGGH